MNKDFVTLGGFTPDQLRRLIARAIEDKALLHKGELPATLDGKTLAMVFEKPSLRTRVSFETAMTQLGGHAIYLAPGDIGLSTREPVRDVARVLGRMCDGIMARTFSHETVEELAEWSPVPVVNALSDYSHPCQAMADLMTAVELLGDLTGRKLAFVGDGNNVARSLAMGASKLGMAFALACPAAYGLDEGFVSSLPDGAAYSVGHDAGEAVAGADIVYTDTWVSMGQEQQRDERVAAFKGFQVNTELLAAAPKGVRVMHCLPAYRGCEITDEVFEAHAETILEQAGNRLHFQRSLLNVLIGRGGIE